MKNDVIHNCSRRNDDQCFFALGDAQQSYAHGYVDSPVSRVKKMRKQTDLDGDLVKTAHSQKLSRHPKELKRQLNY